MKWTGKWFLACLLALTCAFGLTLFLASARSAVAHQADVTPLPPVQGADGRAGACYSFYYDPPDGPDRPFIQMAQDAGSRWDRFDFIWPNIEPSNGSWDFGAYDTLVNDLDAVGMNMVGILLWTPEWAATRGGSGPSVADSQLRPPGWYMSVTPTLSAPMALSASSSPPQGLYLSWNDPNNHWGDYVYHVVSHFGDRVKHWEMWNEPEWPYFWTGTSADYAQLLKVGYQATKAACPDCTVLFGGLHYWMNTSYYKWVLSVLANDSSAPQNNHFFDAMSVHLYSRSSSIYDEVNNIRDGMRAYDVGDHPIWLTETGVPVWGDSQVVYRAKYDYAATYDEAAAYVIQSYANSWASDVEKYFFFRVHDADMGEYFGLTRNDRTLRPAYVAYQVATIYLISPTFTTRVISDSAVSVALWGTPHGKVSVLWNETPVASAYALPAAVSEATIVDRWGVTQTVTAAHGVYTVSLPGATANLVSNPEDYIIGGEPRIVVEAERPSEPPTSTVDVLSEIVYSPTLSVTWRGWDNQSGVCFYDVQVRDGSGEWASWLDMSSDIFGQFAGQHDHTYYFRSRATDCVGNRADWPEVPQARATFDLSSTLHLSIGTFFADENRDHVWNRPITGTNEITLTEEVTLTQVALRFLDASGQDVVSPTVGSTWEFTTTIYAGQAYRLQAASGDYARVMPFVWTWGGDMYTHTYESLALWPGTQVYLPLVLNDVR